MYKLSLPCSRTLALRETLLLLLRAYGAMVFQELSLGAKLARGDGLKQVYKDKNEHSTVENKSIGRRKTG